MQFFAPRPVLELASPNSNRHPTCEGPGLASAIPKVNVSTERNSAATMGRKLNLSYLSEDECERILQVIQRDFELREAEKQRISGISEEVGEEKTKTDILAKQKKFNDNCCMRCFSSFIFIFRKRLECNNCHYNVCKDCCTWQEDKEHYLCKVCIRQKHLELQSCDWFYENVRKRFKRFGSAKVVRSLYKRKSESESENDSGYDPSIYSSLASGRLSVKSRPTLQGLFKATECALPGKGLQPESERVQSPGSSDGSDSSASPKVRKNSYAVVQEVELEKFKHEMSNLSTDLQRTLDNQTPHGVDEHSPAYEQAMDNYKNHVERAVANLIGTLSSAKSIENLSSPHTSPSHSYNDIQQVVTKQVEEMLGKPVDSSHVADQSFASDSSTASETEHGIEESLANAIVKKTAEDYRQQQQEKLERLEAEQALCRSSELPNTGLSEHVIDEESEENSEQGTPKMVDRSLSTGGLLDEEAINQHGIPLPDFCNDSFDDSRIEIDPDLLSTTGTEYSTTLPDTDNDSMGGWDTESLSSTRSWTGNWFFREKNVISPYDNFGEKKVGKEEGNTRMFVPESNQRYTPMIGNRDVDELSDHTLTSGQSSSEAEDVVDESANGYERDPATSAQIQAVTSEIVSQFTRSESVCDDDDLEKLVNQNVSVLEEQDVKMKSPERSIKSPERSSFRKKQAEKKSDSLPRKSHPTQVSSQTTSPVESPAKVAKIQQEPVETGSEADNPKFAVKPKSMKVPEGEPAKFSCEIQGTPPLDVFWYRDTSSVQQLEDGEKYETLNQGNKYSLEVFNTTPEDVGQYMCIVISELGQSYWTFGLQVTDNDMDKSKPQFLKKPEDKEVIEGQSAKFRCKVKGYPPPRVSWYKDGKRLKSSEFCTLSKTGNRDYLLAIDFATLDDDAEYTVVAKNVVGEVKATVELLVEPAANKDASPPHQKLASPSHLSKTTIKPTEPRELIHLTEKVSQTQKNVSSTAEDVLTSANKLSDINKQLDEMDKQLNNMEDISTTKEAPTHLEYSNEDVGTDALNNNAEPNEEQKERILAQYEGVKASASAVRKITSTALEIIASAEDVMSAQKNVQSEEQEKQVVQEKSKTENPDETTPSKTKTILANVDSRTTEKRKSPVPLSPSEMSYEEFERYFNAGRFTQDASVPTTGGKGTELDGGQELEDLTIDCGLKRVDSKRYKRDFIVNNTPKMQRKKWEVKLPSPTGTEIVKSTPPANALDELAEQEEQIYMSAGKVFTLEDKIKQLEGNVTAVTEDTPPQRMTELEDQVARAVAQVAQSEKQVKQVESRVEHMHEAQRSKSPESPPKAVLVGQTSEEEIPESQAEFDSQEELNLPSVKSLRERFNQGQAAEGVTRVANH